MSRRIEINDFLENHILRNIKISDSCQYGLFTVVKPDLESNEYEKHIMYFDTSDPEIRELDLPFSPDDYFPDKNEILFKQLVDGKTVFHSFCFDDMQCRELFEIPFSVKKMVFGESKLYFTAEVDGTDMNNPLKSSNRGPFFREGRGVSGDGVISLFQAELDGRGIRLISSLLTNIDQVDFDLPNDRIVYSAFKTEGFQTVDSAIYCFNIKSESVSLLFDKGYRISYLQSMSSRSVLFMGVDLSEKSRNDNQQIYLIDLERGEIEQNGNTLGQSNENICVVTDSIFGHDVPVQRYRDHFYFKQVAEDREILCRISLTGEKEILLDSMNTISSYCVTEKGIYLIGLKDLQLSELYFFDGSDLIRISDQNRWLDHKLVAKAEKLSVEVDGVAIDGYVYPPVHVDPEVSYPAVLMIHGGPKMIYSDVFAHDIQLLCANGYYVFNANPMGSDGRGDEFSNIRGQFGILPYRQLMAFTDEVLKRFSLIDGNRLGIIGGSYGGYLTNYIITRTHCFQAAVSERGISNLSTAFTSSEIGTKYIFEYMGNSETPWSDPQSYLEASPIAAVDKVRTPTLFIHGKEDYTCHYTESLNMYSALNYLGIESRFCLFEDEGHGLVVSGRPGSKLQRYKEVLMWFDKYLKKEQVN